MKRTHTRNSEDVRYGMISVIQIVREYDELPAKRQNRMQVESHKAETPPQNAKAVSSGVWVDKMKLEYQKAEFMIGWRLGAAGKQPNPEQSRHIILMQGYELGSKDHNSAWRRRTKQTVACPLCGRSCTLKSDGTFRYHSGCAAYCRTPEQAKTMAAERLRTIPSGV